MSSLPSGYIEVKEENRIVIHSKFWYRRKENLKGKTGRWSKWGKVENTFQESIKDWWYCQSCNEEYPEELSPLVYQVAADMNIRVCPFCFENDCEAYRERLKDLSI